MRIFIVCFLTALIIGCGETSEKKISPGKLMNNWVFKNPDYSLSSMNAVSGKIELRSLKETDVTANGMELARNGRVVVFKIIKSKRQNMKFIQAMWGYSGKGSIQMSMMGAKPEFEILELNDSTLTLKKI